MALLSGLLAAAAASFGVLSIRHRESLLAGMIASRSTEEGTGLGSGWRRAAVPCGALSAFWVVFSYAGLPVGLAAAAGVVLAPRLLRRRRAARAADLLESQLSEGIAAVSAGLRAGMSLSQAVGFAGEEVPEPLAGKLKGVADREAMGVPLGEALDAWAGSVDSPDFRLAASVLQLHRRTGGDLPMVLDRLSRTLADRRAAVRESRSLTAQARLSGGILGFLPIGFFLFLSVMSPQDMAAAYRTPAGLAAIIGGFTMQGIAFLWIRSLLRVEA